MGSSMQADRLELVVDNDPHKEAVKAIRKDREPPDDWLTPMAVGTEFLARRRHLWDGPDVDHYTFLGEVGYYILLLKNYEDKTWVDPIVFCSKNKLLEILTDGETEDGEDHRI